MLPDRVHFPTDPQGRLNHESLYEYGRGVRYYRLPGQPGDEGLYPGVTSVLRVWPAGADALDRWKRGLIVDSWIQDPERPGRLAKELGPQGARRALIDIPDGYRDNAAAEGTAAHELVLADFHDEVEPAGGTDAWLKKHHPLVRGDRVAAKAQQCMQAVIDYELDPGAYEAVGFYNDGQHRFAGAVDLIAQAHPESRYAQESGYKGNQSFAVYLDFKTGKGVYETAGMQLAAYTRFAALAVPQWLKVEEHPQIHAKSAAIIHAGTTSYKLVPVNVGVGWGAFKAALAVWRLRDCTPLIKLPTHA